MTANIGYHHVHHLSAKIPNYQLRACHEANADLFVDVQRLTVWDLLSSLKCLLWDCEAERIISFKEYEQISATTNSQPAPTIVS